MTTPLAPRSLSRWIALGALGLLAASAGLVWLAATRLDAVAFLLPDARAAWITPRQGSRVTAIPVVRSRPLWATFERRLVLRERPARAVLHGRALREVEIAVNGAPVALEGRDPAQWRTLFHADVSELLAPGRNQLAVRVANPDGPPLLQLWLEGVEPALATGPGWRVVVEQRSVRAVVADDVRRYPPSQSLPVPARVLAARWPVALLLFLPGALLAWAAARAPQRLAWLSGPHAPRAALAAVALLWLALLGKAAGFPVHLGFDAEEHAAYLAIVAREGRLPLATEGSAMFHPPLFYAGAALLERIGGGVGRHSLSILSGVVCAFVAGRLSLLLFPARHGSAALAVLATGLLPMGLLLGSFVSNESLHAAWTSLALWAACAACVEPRAATGRLAALGGLLGAALLTKATSLLVAPVAIGVVTAKLWLVEGRGLRRALAAAGAMAALALAVAGWWYARSALLYGSPFATNYDIRPGFTYWLIPGFHTPAWFLRFGEVLSHPFFASFASCWDGLYSTFWGDGNASGRAGVEYPSPHWDYDWMAAVSLLALPASALGLAGFARLARGALAAPAPGARLAFAMLVALIYGLLFTVVAMCLRLPHYGFPKAFYALPVAAPLGLCFAAGIAAADAKLAESWATPARVLLWGSSTLLAGAIALAFLGRGQA